MLQVEALEKRFGDRLIFEDLSFTIERGNKVGFIAPNGTGKTTLMNMLVGKEPYQSGKIQIDKDIRWAYLAQLPEIDRTATVLDACFNQYDPIAKLCLDWERASSENDSETMNRLLPEMEASGAWHYEQRAKEILSSLGIRDFQKSAEKLSGGEAKRIALAAALICEPDLLFLDEPTNHLDIETIEWLENYLSRSTMSLILITHDRYFLDRVCNTIMELDAGTIYRYKGNYAYFLEKRDERLQAEAANLARNKNILRRELEWMRRQPQARAGKARYRIDAFHRLDEATKQRKSEQEVKMLSADAGHIGKKIFEAHGVCKAYGEKVILHDFEYIFSPKDKVGIVGDNGVGKTTFIKMLMGLEPIDKGRFDLGETLRFGYYAQETPAFPEDKKVIDIISDIAEHITIKEKGGETLTAQQILTRFLFPVDRQYTPVAKLSGGELRRLYLCSILIQRPNFLILDEPTNDLDILTLNVLEEYLQEFTGCLLVVSHDRFFMDKVVEHLLCFQGEGKVKDFPATYSDYRAYLTEVKEQEAKAQVKSQTKEEKASKEKPRHNKAQKLTFAEKRELEQIVEQVEALEKEKTELEEQMSSGSLSPEALQKAGGRIGEVIEEMDMLTLRQLELEDKQA